MMSALMKLINHLLSLSWTFFSRLMQLPQLREGHIFHSHAFGGHVKIHAGAVDGPTVLITCWMISEWMKTGWLQL